MLKFHGRFDDQLVGGGDTVNGRHPELASVNRHQLNSAFIFDQIISI